MPSARIRKIFVIALISGGTFGISIAASGDEDKAVKRWYSEQQVAQGKNLYLTNCAECHGRQAEGTTEWRKLDSSGNYPPPPLNGSAHAWHHSLLVLERSIAEGGIPNGGVMPGFADSLSRDEMRATVAYFQSFWPDDIYIRWQEIDSR